MTNWTNITEPHPNWVKAVSGNPNWSGVIEPNPNFTPVPPLPIEAWFAEGWFWLSWWGNSDMWTDIVELQTGWTEI
jgi:hypothetical protein